MAQQRVRGLHSIEGQQVDVALRDGTRIDDCQLVSSGRRRAQKLWLFVNGEDMFVSHGDVVDVWESDAGRTRAA